MLTIRERDYLAGQTLGRLATVRPDGSPQNKPVGFGYNEATGTVDITGRNLAGTQKFRNLARKPLVAFVVDDLASRDPWQVRGVEIRGHAESLCDQEPANPWAGGEIIRIHPKRIISWGLDPDTAGMKGRDVETSGKVGSR